MQKGRGGMGTHKHGAPGVAPKSSADQWKRSDGAVSAISRWKPWTASCNQCFFGNKK